MNDDMQQWLPVAEHLKNISLSGLYTFKDIIEAEIAMRQESFYNAENSSNCGENGNYNTCTKEKKPAIKLEVVK